MKKNVDRKKETEKEAFECGVKVRRWRTFGKRRGRGRTNGRIVWYSKSKSIFRLT